MITLNLKLRVKPDGREELIEALRVLFGELSKGPTFVDAWLHTTEEEPDLIVVFERWKETKESLVRGCASDYGSNRIAFGVLISLPNRFTRV